MTNPSSGPRTGEMAALRMHTAGEPDALVHESAPCPSPGTGDVLVEVHAAGYTPGELAWPSTWVDRSGHDRTPIVPCHEFSGVVAALGFGTAGLAIGDEVYGMQDWYRDGAAAQLTAVEARNLAPRPQGVDHAAAATLPLAGLTAWQGLFRHGHLAAGDTVAVLGAAGAVGSLAVQLARNAGAQVIGVGHDRDLETVTEAGAQSFIDLGREPAADLADVTLVFDTIGGPLANQLAHRLRDNARLVSIVDPLVPPALGHRGVFFVVEPDHACLLQIADLVNRGVIQPRAGETENLADGRAAIVSKEQGRTRGKLILVP